MAIYSDSGFITARDTPLIRPALDLNFAREKRLDSRVLFTRGSSGTYTDESGIIRTAANNVPRFDHDPTTGESLGLLIEESRTNQFPYSSEFDNSAWNTSNSNVTANQITAPDGTVTADKISADATATEARYVNDDTSITSGNVYTQSVFAKAGEVTVLQIAPSTGFSSRYQNFDLSTGQLGNGDVESASITAYPNGWYRCTVTQTAITTISGRMVMAFATVPGDGRIPSPNISLGDGLYLWGAQLEVGSFATSYIPTSGSTVTRAADLASISGTNFAEWYNPTESSIICSYSHIMSTYPIASGNERLYRFRAVGGNDTRIDFVTYNDYHPYIAADGSTVASLGGFTSLYNNQENKTAVGIQQNNFVNSFNGQIKVTDSSGAWPPNNSITEIFLGSQAGGNFLNGHINKFLYYPKRLPNAQLQALTS